MAKYGQEFNPLSDPMVVVKETGLAWTLYPIPVPAMDNYDLEVHVITLDINRNIKHNGRIVGQGIAEEAQAWLGLLDDIASIPDGEARFYASV